MKCSVPGAGNKEMHSNGREEIQPMLFFLITSEKNKPMSQKRIDIKEPHKALGSFRVLPQARNSCSEPWWTGWRG